ncbi:hypothetical protein OCH239_09870 [Roseivivax halodurans JCM 10272]|uniref:Uncharacterized protein n=1 Tax=Roseivivax halodurans JCM 10272 TaxID=1449350 RepID=X7ECB2_9RHOB|nr:hypothetical protein [Roseivivax halodurans]ETX13577.1 hypothetical protein OCH239_09870 [Roseivivax halodurans JCM 10272]
MPWIKGLWTLAFSIYLPAAVSAEWRVGHSEIFIDEPSAFGISDLGIGALAVMCDEGAPYLWTQGWPAAAGPDREERVSITVDGRPYLLTGTHYPPDGLWTGHPSAELLAALRGGTVAVVAPPGQPAWQFSLSGSARAMSSALSECSGAASAAPPAQAENSGLPAPVVDVVTQACGGGFTLAEDAILSGRIDNDTEEDVVLDWADVSCNDRSRGRGAGFCGAALCTIEVFLTETSSRKQILGLNPVLIDRAFGQVALRTSTQGVTCGGAAQGCDILWNWTGTALEAAR